MRSKTRYSEKNLKMDEFGSSNLSKNKTPPAKTDFRKKRDMSLETHQKQNTPVKTDFRKKWDMSLGTHRRKGNLLGYERKTRKCQLK